jgi:hypothetical protein
MTTTIGTGARPGMGLLASNGFGMFMLGTALALGAAFGAQSLSRAIAKLRDGNTINVKGSAAIDVRADHATWRAVVQSRGGTREEAFLRLAEAMERVQRSVTGAGFTSEETTISAIDTIELPKRDDKGNTTNAIEGYTLRQSLLVESTKVDAVESIARRITDLIRDGVPVDAEHPAYTISSIEEQKMRLLDQATRNAMDRAKTLADGSGSSVGELRKASQGIIQVLARGSVDGGDWGQYDTSTIEKTMRAVVSLEYAVD